MGERWIHEVKWDGYCIQARVAAGKVRLLTRNGHDCTERYPAVVEALRTLALKEAMFDGEVIVPNHASGDFSALHSRKRHSDVQYQMFDLLWINGRDLRDDPLFKRRAAFAAVMPAANQPSPLNMSNGSKRQTVCECLRAPTVLG